MEKLSLGLLEMQQDSMMEHTLGDKYKNRTTPTVEQLRQICRFCGKWKPERRMYPKSTYELHALYSLAVHIGDDDPTIHPPRICETCRARLYNWKRRLPLKDDDTPDYERHRNGLIHQINVPNFRDANTRKRILETMMDQIEEMKRKGPSMLPTKKNSSGINSPKGLLTNSMLGLPTMSKHAALTGAGFHPLPSGLNKTSLGMLSNPPTMVPKLDNTSTSSKVLNELLARTSTVRDDTKLKEECGMLSHPHVHQKLIDTLSSTFRIDNGDASNVHQAQSMAAMALALNLQSPTSTKPHTPMKTPNLPSLSNQPSTSVTAQFSNSKFKFDHPPTTASPTPTTTATTTNNNNTTATAHPMIASPPISTQSLNGNSLLLQPPKTPTSNSGTPKPNATTATTNNLPYQSDMSVMAAEMGSTAGGNTDNTNNQQAKRRCHSQPQNSSHSSSSLYANLLQHPTDINTASKKIKLFDYNQNQQLQQQAIPQQQQHAVSVAAAHHAAAATAANTQSILQQLKPHGAHHHGTATATLLSNLPHHQQLFNNSLASDAAANANTASGTPNGFENIANIAAAIINNNNTNNNNSKPPNNLVPVFSIDNSNIDNNLSQATTFYKCNETFDLVASQRKFVKMQNGVYAYFQDSKNNINTTGNLGLRQINVVVDELTAKWRAVVNGKEISKYKLGSENDKIPEVLSLADFEQLLDYLVHGDVQMPLLRAEVATDTEQKLLNLLFQAQFERRSELAKYRELENEIKATILTNTANSNSSGQTTGVVSTSQEPLSSSFASCAQSTSSDVSVGNITSNVVHHHHPLIHHVTEPESSSTTTAQAIVGDDSSTTTKENEEKKQPSSTSQEKVTVVEKSSSDPSSSTVVKKKKKSSSSSTKKTTAVSDASDRTEDANENEMNEAEVNEDCDEEDDEEMDDDEDEAENAIVDDDDDNNNGQLSPVTSTSSTSTSSKKKSNDGETTERRKEKKRSGGNNNSSDDSGQGYSSNSPPLSSTRRRSNEMKNDMK